MTPKTAPPPPPPQNRKKDKGKIKGKKRHRINLKGWLKTPADWERFNTWAKINSLPKRIPEQEPIVRLTKPLSQMKKRIQILSQPVKKRDTSAVCRLDLSISKAALKAKASKRIKKLSKFILREPPHCREFPIKIRKAALSYEPSERIIQISKPHIRVSEECKTLEVSKKALKHNITEREQIMSLPKKAIECPDSLSDEERGQLMTSTGIMKSALTYKFTPWMSLLSLPSYRYLKDRNDKNAEAWKKKIIEESETRGKKALKEKLKKEEKERKKKLEKKKKAQKEGEAGMETVENADEGEKNEVEEDKTEPDITGEDAGPQEEKIELEGAEVAEDTEKTDEDEGDKNEVEEDKTEDEITDEVDGPQEGQIGPEGAEVTENKGKTDEDDIEGSKYQRRKVKKVRKRKRETKEQTEDNQEAKRRKAERNAWRFTPCPFKEEGVKKSALKGKVPPRVNELSKPNIRKDQVCRTNPFGVKESALSASASPRIIEIAKPTRPRDPVERPPPREKDDFGRPIFPIPVYKRILPEVKYKEAECKTKEEEKEEDKSKEKPKKKIKDLIAFMPSIDPYVDPKQAKRQVEARKKLSARKNKSTK